MPLIPSGQMQPGFGGDSKQCGGAGDDPAWLLHHRPKWPHTFLPALPSLVACSGCQPLLSSLALRAALPSSATQQRPVLLPWFPQQQGGQNRLSSCDQSCPHLQGGCPGSAGTAMSCLLTKGHKDQNRPEPPAAALARENSRDGHQCPPLPGAPGSRALPAAPLATGNPGG